MGILNWHRDEPAWTGPDGAHEVTAACAPSPRARRNFYEHSSEAAKERLARLESADAIRVGELELQLQAARLTIEKLVRAIQGDEPDLATEEVEVHFSVPVGRSHHFVAAPPIRCQCWGCRRRRAPPA